MSAGKYSNTKEMSPLNEGIQAEHLQHTQMNKRWYVESCERLPEAAEGTANIREEWKIGRGAERKAEQLSVRKGLTSAGQLTNKETLKVSKKMQEEFQSFCLQTPTDNSFHTHCLISQQK